MTVAQIIAEIQRLPLGEQAEIIRFAYKLDAERRLTGEELSALAERMVKCSDAKEGGIVREAIVRGFYGTRDDA